MFSAPFPGDQYAVRTMATTGGRAERRRWYRAVGSKFKSDPPCLAGANLAVSLERLVAIKTKRGTEGDWNSPPEVGKLIILYTYFGIELTRLKERRWGACGTTILPAPSFRELSECLGPLTGFQGVRELWFCGLPKTGEGEKRSRSARCPRETQLGIGAIREMQFARISGRAMGGDAKD